MSNLNKFKDFCQVFEKIPRPCFMKKKKFKASSGMSKQIFLAQDF
jgi:hypothetical protein